MSKIMVDRKVSGNTVIERFIYDHQNAIENYKFVKFLACTANVEIANDYLQSLLDLLGSTFYRFTDGKVHNNEDIIYLEDTTGIIVTYNIIIGNIYTRKIFIEDQDLITITRDEDGSIINVIASKEGDVKWLMN